VKPLRNADVMAVGLLAIERARAAGARDAGDVGAYAAGLLTAALAVTACGEADLTLRTVVASVKEAYRACRRDMAAMRRRGPAS
jgi:hypothetical protein